MEELQIGEYIRTLYHKIEKIEKITKENGWTCITTNKNAYELQWLKNNKIKHSKNKIDLIEIGDYANGEYVYKLENSENEDKWVHTLNGHLYYEKDIETIWTKEQLKTIEYNTN